MSRIPYPELPLTEKRAIHDWLTEHHVDHTAVPVESQFEYDDATGEWLIPVFDRDSRGRLLVDPETGTLRLHVIRRQELRPLPWREADLALIPRGDTC